MSVRPPGEQRIAGGAAAAFAATVIWGAQLPIAKGAFVAVDGVTMTLVRYGAALVVFAVLLAWREGWRSFAAGRQRWLHVIVAGSALAASVLMLFTGLSMTRPEVAAIILALQPVMTALAEWGLTRRRPPPFTLSCIGIAFLGVALVVTRGGAAFSEPAAVRGAETMGNLLALGAAVTWVAYTMLTARIQGWSTLRVSTLTSIPMVALVVLVWLLAYPGDAIHIDATRLPAAAWRLAYVSLFGVVVAMFLWTAGLQRIGAVDAMLLANMMPIVAFVYRAVEGARYQPIELFGVALVVGALVANGLSMRRRLRLG